MDPISFARSLRAHSTKAESLLWSRLRRKQLDGFYFRRQVPMKHYIADFACHRAKLIIELDGGQHSERRAYDAERTTTLNGEGYRVLRFWNVEVLRELEAVVQLIREALWEEVFDDID